MEGIEPTAPESSGGHPRVMDKSAYELINFLLYLKSKDENRSTLMYAETANPRPCRKCGEIHVTLIEFYYHYN